MKTIKIINSTSPASDVFVKYCDTFLSRFRGLMLSKELDPDYGIIIVEEKESRINTSIHMMFVKQDLTVLWLNKKMEIVDKMLAKKWSPVYVPSKPAQYILELHQSKYKEYEVGDQLIFADIG
jgi:hypothetical protein